MLRILFEDPHIIVVLKEPNQPSVDDPTGDKSLLSCLKEYLSTKENNISHPYIAAIHRLDRPVGGVMVYAKTKFAAGILSEALKAKDFCKRYYAIVEGAPKDRQGVLIDYLLKNSKNMSQVVKENNPQGKKAVLTYQVVDQKDGKSLLAVQLETGRHHQIRVQLSHHQLPILGDRKYGNQQIKGSSSIGLFAYHLEFEHPKTKKLLVFDVKPDNLPFSLFFNT